MSQLTAISLALAPSESATISRILIALRNVPSADVGSCEDRVREARPGRSARCMLAP
jgi:hypothetical protein